LLVLILVISYLTKRALKGRSEGIMAKNGGPSAGGERQSTLKGIDDVIRSIRDTERKIEEFVFEKRKWPPSRDQNFLTTPPHKSKLSKA
jgi:hypothetical protein